MDNPGLPDQLWAILNGGLWHATGPTEFEGILDDGEISIDAPRKYKKSFSVNQRGISLFDLGPTAVDDWGQFNNWAGWFGYHQQSHIAVWLEIDRDECVDALLDAKEAHQIWKVTPGRPTFIPGVEACHRASIPVGVISGVLLISEENRENFRQLSEVDRTVLDQIRAFGEELGA